MYWYMNFVICYLSIISFSYGINVETVRVNTTKGEVEGFIDTSGRNPVKIFKVMSCSDKTYYPTPYLIPYPSHICGEGVH